jgi:Ala-tRNA(Pro) deacylase
MSDIYHILQQLQIQYEKYEHPAVFTVEEAAKHERGEGLESKNSFLRNRKGTRHYLVIMPGNKRMNMKILEEKFGENDLSFASPERLMKYLGITPGSVSVFSLINDIQKEVCVVVDNDLLKSEKQGFHPNSNTATLVISTEDLKKFLEWTGNKIMYVDL